MAPKKHPATVKLTDDEVTEIVRVLGRFKAKDIAPDGTLREIAALDQPALAPIVARSEAILVTRLADTRSLYLHARSAWNTSTHGDGPSRAMRLAVHDRARLLGHTPMIQIAGATFQAECPQCGATGSAYDDFAGAIFHLKCGTAADLATALQ